MVLTVCSLKLEKVALFPPGVLHHIFKSSVGSFHMRLVPYDYFATHSFLGHAMVRHHKLDSYRNAISAMVKAIYEPP